MAEPAEAARQALQEAAASCSASNDADIDNTVGPTDIVDLDLARSVIQDCSVIVGIHPDQVGFIC